MTFVATVGAEISSSSETIVALTCFLLNVSSSVTVSAGPISSTEVAVVPANAFPALSVIELAIVTFGFALETRAVPSVRKTSFGIRCSTVAAFSPTTSTSRTEVTVLSATLKALGTIAVSYTHLTLPTILLV